jgi:hypothetical protein
MKRFYRLSHAFSGCILVAMLTACGGAQMPPLAGALSQSTLGVNPDTKLSGEVLSGTNVRLRYPYNQCPFFGIAVVDFIASGTATGPYPGTFRAKGQWSSENQYRNTHTGFDEHFTITSGSASYSGGVHYFSDQHAYGGCTSISLDQARYKSKLLNARGRAAVNISKDGFSEQFF